MGLQIFGCGWKQFSRTRERGEFVCPHCQQQRKYKVEDYRHWITVLFVPVIPLNSQGAWIECKSCRRHFSDDHLREGDAWTPSPAVADNQDPESLPSARVPATPSDARGGATLAVAHGQQYCGKCGSQWEDGINFCGSCGAKARSESDAGA